MSATHPNPADGRDDLESRPESTAVPRRNWLRRLYMTLRTEHRTPGKVGFGVGVGVFVGCSPFWGVHFPLSVLLATLFRLNRFIVYASAYVGNPLTVGPILFGEIQLGHHLLHGTWLAISLADAKDLGLMGLFADLFVGSIVLGGVLGALLGAFAWLIARTGSHHVTYREIVDAIVVRYVDVSIRDAEGARARLLRDPMFPFLISQGVLGAGLRVLDLGCGRGLVGVLVEMLTPASDTRWYLGVDRNDRYVRAARQALESSLGCTVQTTDLRDFDPAAADVVVMNDVLRFLPFTAQDALMRRLARALPPGARMFVREKDAGAGWRFKWSALSDTIMGLFPGRPHHGTHYRRAGDLRNALIAAGFAVTDRAVARAASPAFVLIEATRRPAGLGRA